MRLLVVEDESALAASLSEALAVEGFVVDVARDGPEGLWYAEANSYDVIILDLMLPGANGFRVCADLRERGDWTPILVLTAKDGEFDEAEALDTGADDYLTKPFSHLVLVAHLRALLRRGAPERPAVLELGDLSLDPATREVRAVDEPLALTRREHMILELLLRRPEIVVTKPEILDAVWGDDYLGNVNIVEVYIGYLRRKLDAAHATAEIETIRGHGYRLVDRPRAG